MSHEFATLDVVEANGWRLKASSLDGMICLVVFHPLFMWSQVRFFNNENEAHNWIEYLFDRSKICLTDDEF